MFFLVGKKSGFVIHKKGTSTIGRISGDIVIKDSSVSRKHAELEVREGVAYLRDCNSKYFTKYNSRIILGNEEIKLEDGGEIAFGEVIFKFHVGENLIVCSTGVKEREQSIASVVKQLGGEILKEWNSTCTHLTTPEILITLKVLHAIMDNKKIVTPQYWEIYLKNITRGQLPPNAFDYYPPLGENIINLSYVEYNPARSTLFEGKTFALWNKKKQSKFEAIIRKAGGEYIFLGETLDENKLLKLMDKYIVMEPEDPTVEKKLSKVFDKYKSKGKRLIPFQEIVLAILQCSCNDNCNPSFNRAQTVFLKQTQKQGTFRPVVPETQSQQIDIEMDVKPNVIQATMDPDVCMEATESVQESLEEPVSTTYNKSLLVTGETQLPAKRIKLDPEIIMTTPSNLPTETEEVTSRKNVDSVFKRMMREVSPPPAKRLKKSVSSNPFAQIATSSKANPYSSIAKEEEDDGLDLIDNPFGQCNILNTVDVKSENTEEDNVNIVERSISNLTKDRPTSSKSVAGADYRNAVKSESKSRKKPKPFAEYKDINYSIIKHDVSTGRWVDSNVRKNEKSKSLSQDEEERKWCEKFNNSVVIVVKDLLKKDRIDQENSQVSSIPNSAKNFKKFRKVPVPKSGVVIKCSRSAFGGSNLSVDYGRSDDEDNRDI